ncbi:hypothetical protein R6Q57_024028 [Mikania cordata]
MGFAFVGSIVVLTLFFRSNFGQQQVIPNTDEFFISDFFQKMGSNSSSFSHVFDISASVCSWQVVLCDANQEHVIGLVATNLGLSGSIPDNTIGKLTKLQSLDLSNNHITDSPSDFWSLGYFIIISMGIKSQHMRPMSHEGWLTYSNSNLGAGMRVRVDGYVKDDVLIQKEIGAHRSNSLLSTWMN